MLFPDDFILDVSIYMNCISYCDAMLSKLKEMLSKYAPDLKR